jgi:hypothetical protein
MPAELFEVNNPLAVAFACDADLNWGEVLEFPTTTRKVEGKGDIADFIAQKPLVATLDGKVTAMTIEPAIPSPQKLVNEISRLKELARKRQVVLVIGETFNGYLGITRVEIGKGVDDGYSFTAKITFKEIETTVAGTAQVPASQLRSKVKKKGGQSKTGGAAKGSKPKTIALQLGLAGGLGKFLPP